MDTERVRVEDPAAAARQAELVAAMQVDLVALESAGAFLPLEIGPTMAFQIVALLQLALRHPDVPESLQVSGRHVVDVCQAFFDGMGAGSVVEVILLGNDPGEAVAQDDAPRIILP